jgi:DNA-binding NarL/FixJ family response regulator
MAGPESQGDELEDQGSRAQTGGLASGADTTALRDAAPRWQAAVVGGTPLLREAFTWWLGASGEFDAVASVEDVGALLAHEADLELDVLLVDVRHADDERIVVLRTAFPELRLVLIGDGLTPALTRQAMRLRADGVVLTTDRSAGILDALRQVMVGRVVYPARWQEHAANVDDDPIVSLSQRQRDVLNLIAKGCSNEEIAQQLCISRNTVKFHMRELFTRLNVRNRVEAAQRLLTHAA